MSAASAQRTDALARANAVRVYNAQRKRDLKAGVTSPRAVMGDPRAGRIAVFDMLVHVPKVRDGKAGAVLRRAGVSPSRRLGGLTLGERERLLLGLYAFPAVADACAAAEGRIAAAELVAA
jgi:hypothetical protein